MDKQEQNKTDKTTENRFSLTKRVVSIHRVPWIGKYLFAIEEAGQSYFLLQNDFYSRQIQEFRYDMEQKLNEAKVLIGNHSIGIKLKHVDAHLLFSQKDFTFQKVEEYQTLQALSSISKSLQYFKYESRTKSA